MRLYELQNTGGIDNLQLLERPTPSPGPEEVLLRLTAATLNYRDLLTIKGGYGSKQKLPLIPLSDAAGVVEAVGSGVTRFKTGDRVVNGFFPNWFAGEPSEKKLSGAPGGQVDGVLSEYRVFPEHALMHAPAHLSDAAAAGLACAGLTAWSAVVKFGSLNPGDTVLTQGTGGVSLFALQFAKLVGARVISTSSNDHKIEKLRTLGADATINYSTTPNWGSQVRALTAGRGVDLVVEVGGAGTLNESIRATRVGGTIAMIGVLADPAGNFRLPMIVMQQLRIQGVTVGSLEDFQIMINAIAVHRLQPVIDTAFPFEQAPEAFTYMAARKHFGKVAITFGS